MLNSEEETQPTTAEQVADWAPCLKQRVRCIISFPDGMEYRGQNACAVGDADVCPRVTAGCPTGEGYELCGPPKHAEQEAASQVPAGMHGGIARVVGHNWLCHDCQLALQEVGVPTFTIGIPGCDHVLDDEWPDDMVPCRHCRKVFCGGCVHAHYGHDLERIWVCEGCCKEAGL